MAQDVYLHKLDRRRNGRGGGSSVFIPDYTGLRKERWWCILIALAYFSYQVAGIALESVHTLQSGLGGPVSETMWIGGLC
jgi:hypothetical protein